MIQTKDNNKTIVQVKQSFNDVLPHSDIEAEKYVLGCLINEPESFERVCNILNSECFYNNANAAIYNVISDLRKSNNPIDFISVSKKIRNIDLIEKSGGAYYITVLSTQISSTSHLEYHATCLVELSAKRKLLRTVKEAQVLITSNADISDVLDMFETSIDEISKSFNPIGSNLESLEIHFSDDIQEPDPILCQGQTLLMSRGNLSFIKGKAKARKSFLSCLFLSSFFGNTSFCIQSGVINGKALLIDTEQSASHVQKVIKRIYRLCGWHVENSNLKVLALREYNFRERQIIMEKAIKEYQPDFVILDGAIDIVGDFNNAEESKIVIGLLMKLSTKYNCHICGVLHEGKGNGELRGHYGAEALNKAETVFDVVKDGELSTVSPNATRNIPFEEFFFKIDEGLPVYVGDIQKQTKSEINNSQIKNIFISILNPGKNMDYASLVKSYTEFSGKSDRTAKRHIADSLVNGIISNSDGIYKLTVKQGDDMPF